MQTIEQKVECRTCATPIDTGKELCPNCGFRQEVEPNYTVVPVVRNPEVNLGDTLRIGIYITGHGPVENSKLFVRIPYGIAEEDSVADVHYHHNWVTEELAVTFTEKDTCRSKAETSKHGFLLDISAAFQESLWTKEKLRRVSKRLDILKKWDNDEVASLVTSPPKLSTLSGGQRNRKKERFESILGEDAIPNVDGPIEHCAPYLIELNIKAKEEPWYRPAQLPGDYELTFVLTYGESGKIHQDCTKSQFHINNFVEEWKFELEIIGTILLFLTVAASILIAIHPFIQT